MNEHIHEIPCDTCIHNRVCNVRKFFKETEVKTTHPFIKVTLECTEYFGHIVNEKTVTREHTIQERGLRDVKAGDEE